MYLYSVQDHQEPCGCEHVAHCTCSFVHTCVWSVTLKCRIEAALHISSTEGPDLVSTENVYVHVRCAVIYSSLRCDAVTHRPSSQGWAPECPLHHVGVLLQCGCGWVGSCDYLCSVHVVCYIHVFSCIYMCGGYEHRVHVYQNDHCVRSHYVMCVVLCHPVILYSTHACIIISLSSRPCLRTAPWIPVRIAENPLMWLVTGEGRHSSF